MINYNDEELFMRTFSPSFYKKVLNESLVSFKKNIKKSEAKELMKKAFNDLINYNYNISAPQEYIYLLKGKYVSRIIPVFTIQDEAIYFYLCKQIEDNITNSRVEGTFGGWRIGNSIKNEEDAELSYVINSYDPGLWLKNWKDFQKYIYTNINKYEFKYALKLDIANFYDSIDINILEKKLYRTCDKVEYKFVDLIIYLLKYWNKRFSCYNENNVGIPQNEFGDQSRLLANFYLNDYDLIMHNACIENDAMYCRFADDQIILFNSEENINKIMLMCNEELRKIGLNLNAGKVAKFTNNELQNYYLFNIIDDLDSKKCDKACDDFFELYNKNALIRSDTFFRRCLTIGLENFTANNRKRIISEIIDEKFLINCSFNHLGAIYKNLNSTEKQDFLLKLKKLCNEIKFNGFHYIVITFLKKNKINDLYNEIIKELKIC